jgi:hypothetical protein
MFPVDGNAKTQIDPKNLLALAAINAGGAHGGAGTTEK